MTTTIPAIETHYDGYRFRSRLEARWGVFFNALGIEYHYESEGYLVGPLGRAYLPDFWLPALGVWVEVKGEMTGLDVSLMDDAVSVPGGLPSTDAYGDRSILILGPIPEPGEASVHWLLSRQTYSPCQSATDFCACHDLRYSQVTFRAISKAALAEVRREPGLGQVELPAILYQVGRTLLRPLYEDIVTARPNRILVPDVRVAGAFRKARSARFEHGEKPDAA